jgi:hypothetical protein
VRGRSPCELLGPATLRRCGFAADRPVGQCTGVRRMRLTLGLAEGRVMSSTFDSGRPRSSVDSVAAWARRWRFTKRSGVEPAATAVAVTSDGPSARGRTASVSLRFSKSFPRFLSAAEPPGMVLQGRAFERDGSRADAGEASWRGGPALQGFSGGADARGWGAIVDPGASWEVGFSCTGGKGRRRAAGGLGLTHR